MEKYFKWHPSPSNNNFVSYSKYTEGLQIKFSVRYDSDGNVDLAYDITKRINPENNWGQGDRAGDSTKKEFNTALAKVLEFLRK